MDPHSSLRRRVWNTVEAGKHTDGARRGLDTFDWFITALIILNVVAIILESERSLYDRYWRLFHAFEIFSLIVFGIEYGLRIWSCTVSPLYDHPVWGRLRYARRPLQLIDLIALVPGFLFFLPDLRFVRAFRLLRILRVLKLGRYSSAVALLGRVLRQRQPELMVMGLLLVILLIISAAALHYAEAEAQPEEFGSIPSALWWAIVTLTTIGYGDVVPQTTLGRILGSIIAVTGIGIVALPTAIIASGFSEELQKAQRAKHRRAEKKRGEAAHLACPHCGKPIQLHAAGDEGR